MRLATRALVFFLALSTMPALALADPFQITSGSFGIGRPLIGPRAGSAALVWINPPAGAFETDTRRQVSSVSATWEPGDGYTSTLLGTNAPVQPLNPGPIPVEGTFSSNGPASFSFQTVPYDQSSPSLNQSIHLQFSGGDFDIPSVFPPTDDEGLYVLRAPFTMAGRWTVFENSAILFKGSLSGAGTAHLVLGANQQTGESIISQVFYEFQDTAPVPEPSTLALMGITGLVLAARRRIRRHRTT